MPNLIFNGWESSWDKYPKTSVLPSTLHFTTAAITEIDLLWLQYLRCDASMDGGVGWC